jgi:small subunit ribosomal protein S4e
MTHLKRHMMPPGWKVNRKGKTYVVSPKPGPHPKNNSIPLQIVVRDLLKYAETGNEAKKIINSGYVLVDGVVRKDYRYPAGFMDSITIKPTKEHFRFTIGSGGLSLEKISAEDGGKKLCIIKSKYTKRGKKQCLSLHDGRTIVLDKETGYKPGDTIAIEVPSQKIIGHFGLEKGSEAVIINGKNTGIRGKIKEIRNRRFMTEKNVILLESEGREIETLKSYVMAIGKVAKK